ncbi:uncharacterized protein SPAPADRAFT_140188 [Spathaspora passalidarum NRRL Y-27907]|uniref:Uncharacterized protein n=1 Tax=Spathaspora passalidarum (strain NRRL Y-27907 / 11-Y1) TaxID=619300 RepID=G3AS06_SPAPN|nr:uncharacterized protein SPAPADRAFT_140188 [Spathaspora passalidarum NRRL Y-27907]EGW31855.1 hypothetical protein SPAPADRAFT_140188 [Spathaspora passalidarum NRRL Y-27907]
MPRMKPRIVISDWDETITAKDTIKYVAETAYINKPNCTPPFSYFTNVYLDAYNKYSNSFGPRSNLDQEIKFQSGMAVVENTSIQALADHRIFSGLTKDQFRLQANKIELRPGFVEFLTKCQTLDIPFVILSVNWTRIPIIECLKLHGFSVDDDKIKVIANEFVFEKVEDIEITTGDWDNSINVRISSDKLNIVERLRRDKQLVYIGDSSNDLLPLLEADIACAIQGTKIVDILDKYSLNQPNYHIGDWHNFINLLQ